MATQNAHQTAFTSAAGYRGEQAEESVGARIAVWMQQAYCGLHGHDNLTRFEKERVYLQCVSCGHETPGWALTEAAPKIVLRGDARRHRISRPTLVTTRRVA